MPLASPPQLEAARAQLDASLAKVEGRPVDVVKESWPDVEKAVIKVLGGPFVISRPEHQVVALGLCAAFAERLAADHAVFWFPSRESPEGAELGFAEALMKLSPFGAVSDALASGRLAKLDDVTKDIRGSIAQAKFGAGAPSMRLRAEDYMRLFDAGFVQVLALDTAKAGQTWNSAPERLSIDIREALTRATKLPAELKQQLEQQLLSALARMEPGKPIISQVIRAPRVIEMMGLLNACGAATGSAPEEFWLDVVMPLLFVGAPDKFPELEEEELKVAKQGVDPLFLFLDIVPHQFKSPDDGLLGAFPSAGLGLPDPGFAPVTSLRLVKVTLDAIREPIKHFDPVKSRDALRRFGEAVRAKTGPVTPQGTDEAKQMLDAAIMLLEDLKKVVESGKDVCVRRLTEAEAASEPALAQLRSSLQGLRIILTT